MKLKALLNGINCTITGSADINVTHVTFDSREVQKDGMFICIKGYVTDGHQYVKQAVANGARVIVVMDEVQVSDDITIVRCRDTRKAMAVIGIHFYGDPAASLDMIGITGTNGKTSTEFLLEHILKKAQISVGLIGTIENHIGDMVIQSARTTPESFDLQGILNEMQRAGAESVVMEVSSHALALDRVYGIQFKVGVFTNLTQDHLDFHQTMEEYLKEKSKLFTICEYGVVNIDDRASEYMIGMATCKKMYTYSMVECGADFYAADVFIGADCTKWTLKSPEGEFKVNSKLLGKFNVYNMLAATAAAYCMGISVQCAVDSFCEMEGVKGRFQSINSQRGFTVIIDYAHSPDGLLNVLQSIGEFYENKVITVFGGGGNRDKSKRPIMGKIAGEHSDFCIITSDNPRDEEPMSIIEDMEVGVRESGTPYKKCEDRRMAIQMAIEMAEPGDVVLVAGKGHENYQIIGTEKYHFDDAEVVYEILAGE